MSIRRLQNCASDKAAASRLLAESFVKGPLFAYAFASKCDDRLLGALFDAVVDDAIAYGVAEGAFDDGLAGLLLWYPPRAYPMTLWRELRGLPAWLQIAAAAPGGLFRLFRVQSALDRMRPGAPHCHGYFMAGRAGARTTALLGRRMLEEADANGWASYLETQDARTVALYRRLGFAIRDCCVAGPKGAPPSWTMWREPRGPRAAGA